MSAGGSGRTPGEWYAVKDRWRWTVSARDPFGDGEDCWLADVGSGVERAAVDARLMAAAPDLYDALVVLEAVVAAVLGDGPTGATQPAALAEARAALAKAEGREPRP